MRFLRNIIFRIFWLVFALHIFNCSADAPNDNEIFYSDIVCINKMESIGELIIEKVFNFQNAIPERKNNNQKEECVYMIKKGLHLYTINEFKNIAFEVSGYLIIPIELKQQIYFQFHPEIFPPPPKS